MHGTEQQLAGWCWIPDSVQVGIKEEPRRRISGIILWYCFLEELRIDS